VDDAIDREIALASGDEVQALSAARELLAEQMLNVEGKDIAPISRELRAVLVDLRRLGAGRQESALDEIAARRAKRRAARPAEPTGT
jgi:hypothetical protein